jgi:hypothetical protein
MLLFYTLKGKLRDSTLTSSCNTVIAYSLLYLYVMDYIDFPIHEAIRETKYEIS